MRHLLEGRYLNEASLLILMLCALLIANMRKIMDFWSGFFDRKLTILRSSIGESGATGKTKEVLQDQLDEAYFKYATRISAEKRKREALIQLHESAQGELSWIHLKRASQFLDPTDKDKVMVKVGRWDRFFCWYSAFVAVLFTFVSVFFVSVIPFCGNLKVALAFLGVGGLAGIVAMIVFAQTFPVSSARRIEKFIQKAGK